MADVRSITNPTINKISKAEYDLKVEAGIITSEMIEDQVWLEKDLTIAEQNKVLGIEEGAQVNVIEKIKVNGVEQVPADKVVDITCSSLGAIENETDPTVPAWAKEATKPTYTYDEITDKPTLFSGSYNDLTDKPTIPSVEGLASENYVNTKVADLVNSAPETLDTLGELATAIQSNQTVVDAINESIANKANASDLAAVATSGSYNDLIDVPTGCILKIWG